jgi:beta-mannosidase
MIMEVINMSIKRRKTISLNGEWKLFFHPEYDGRMEEYNSSFLDTWQCIKAMVPGNIEVDLYNANLEKDPYYGENLYSYSKYEYYQWIFMKDLIVPQYFNDDKIILCFHGIDTIADAKGREH